MHRTNPSVLFAIIAQIIFHSESAQTCYYPNGTVFNETTDFLPCPQPGLETICCGLNRTIPSGSKKENSLNKNVCLPNGLCQYRVIDDQYTKETYWRTYCTEKDWVTGKCLNVCTNDTLGGKSGAVVQMIPCDGTTNSTKWCCGRDCSCSDEANVHSLSAVFGEAISDNSNQNSKSGLSIGAKAGIGIAAAIGLFALIGSAFFVVKAFQWKNKAAKAEQSEGADRKNAYTEPVVYHELLEAPPAELSSRTGPRPELE